MMEQIAAEIGDWLLDYDYPLLTLYSIVLEHVGPDLSLGEFLSAVDQMVESGRFELWQSSYSNRTRARLDRLPTSIEERYAEVGIPKPWNHDPLDLSLRLPPGQRELNRWQLHDDMGSMTFRLTIREGDPSEILAGAMRIRPEFVRSPTQDSVEDGVRVVSGTIERSTKPSSQG